MNKFIQILLVALLALTFASDLDAQRKGKKKRPTERSSDEQSVVMTSDFKDRLTAEILLSNGGLNFGNPFAIGLKTSVGYKVIDRIALGVAGKYNYVFFNNQGGDDISFSDLGVGLFSKIKIVEAIYAQVEYDFNWFGDQFTDFRENHNGFQIGAGYLQGFGDWKFGFTALFNLTNSVRDASGSNFELYLGGHYNF